MSWEPKKENANTGFHYTVSDEQIKAHQMLRTEEVLEWLEETAKFIYEIQTPEEKGRMNQAKNFK